jgi:hypothetical protein
LLERTLDLKIDETYPKLKAAYLDKGCKIISEEPPNQICFKQGSLWGIAPQTAKKTISATLTQFEGRTRIKCSSKLASDWKNITLIGCALAFVLVGLCVWMATDLSAFMVTREPSFWSWLVTVGGNLDVAVAHAFVNLTWGLAFFLSVIILVEATIVVYAHYRIDLSAQEALNLLD